jgi:hypothetical protein
MRTILTIAVLATVLAAIAPRPVSAERLPVPFIARNVCPFECCIYGTWVPRRPLRIFARERDTSRVAFTLARGDSFEAVTGNVHVLRPGIAVVRRAFSLDGTGGSLRAVPGDRMYLLDQGGEGAVHVWCKGQFVWTSDEFFYFDESTPRGDPARVTRLLRDVESEWWVQVRARDGRSGWLRMSDDPYEPMEVDGADPCG